MYRQHRVPYPLQRKTTRKAVWNLLRVVVLLAGVVVLGATGASQDASASTGTRTVAQPSIGQSDSAAPSEPSGHRPASGTTSLLVKLNSNFSADQARQLVADNGGAERATVPALHVVVVDVPSAQLQSIRGRYQKD